MELVTGRTGTPHVTSQQDRMLNQGTFGAGTYILNTGQLLEPQVQSSNEIRIRDGAIMVQGALGCIKVNTYDSVTIQNGNQGMQRIDLIVWQYTYDAEQDVESADWVVIQGTPAESDPQQPLYTSGDIQEGDELVQIPVFEVHLDGINVTEVKKLLSVSPDIPTLNAYLAELSEEELIQDGLSVCTDVHAAVSGGSPKEVMFYRYGKTINMRLNIRFSASIAQYATIFRLPSELRPKIPQFFINNNGNVFSVNSESGAVTTQQSIPSGAWLQISMSYLLA